MLIVSLGSFFPAHDAEAQNAGYSEFFIPGDEDNLHFIFSEFNGHGSTGVNRAIISVTAWQGTTTLYYDHWEDGYDLDQNNLLGTADEMVLLANAGDTNTFETAAVTVPRPAVDVANQCVTGAPGVNERNCDYDGRDRIISVGGAVTLSRASWDNTVGTVQSAAWEVYPVSPLLTTYILPFGEDLYSTGLVDFQRVFALIQATEGTTTVSVNYDGTAGADTLCDRSGNNLGGGGPVTSVTLALGEVFLLDNVSACSVTSLNTGTRIDGNRALQVQYMIGNSDFGNYEIRGFSAFPRGFWSKEYYAPVPGHGGGANTDIYLFNPQSTTLNVDWETNVSSGSFTIPATSVASFQGETGSFVPQDTAVYLRADQVFWGVASVDTESRNFDWGYSLVPVELLTPEHYLAWAPGSEPTSTGGDADNSGVFVTSAQDAIQVFVDYDNDGIVDDTYNLNRLDTQYIFDPSDGDMSNAHIFATGNYVAAYGQNPDLAPGGSPAIDVGYTMLPNIETETVLSIEKTTNPTLVPTASGQIATYSLTIRSYDFGVDDINVQETLPTGWSYVTDSTTITRADLSQLSGAAANPTSLLWDNTLLGSLAQNQTITIVFQAITTQNFNVGDITRNVAVAIGTRTVNGVVQTFTASDFVFNSFGELQITKTSSVPTPTPLSPGDTYSYSVTVTNPPGGPAYTLVSIYDSLPPGLTYVASSSSVTIPVAGGPVFALDQFTAQSYANNDGDINWTGNWIEVGDTPNGSPTTGDTQASPLVGGLLAFLGTSIGGSGGNVPRSISRTLDASSFAAASLSFNYLGTGGVTAADVSSVVISSSGGPDIVTPLPGVGGAIGPIVIPTAYLTSDLTIRFQVTAGFSVESRAIDNVRIDATQLPGIVTNPANDPPNFVSSSNGYDLPAGTSMVLTFDVTVDDPLANGINSIENIASATAAELPVPISASATNIVNNPGAGSATVGQRIWLDADGDGIFDVGESGLAGVEVTLRDDFGAPLATTTTDSNGIYSFTGIPAGIGYYVEATNGVPGGLSQTSSAGPVLDSTPKFDLIDAQNFTGANIGYNSAPGTTTIGDLVWSDVDGNGVQNGGEAGLGGVTVELWLDVNGNGAIDGGDTLSASTVSAANGSYLFTGVAVDGATDYIIFTNPNQVALTGYNFTTASIYSLIDPVDSQVYLAADFGLQGNGGGTPLYTITDRLWYDSNADGDDESGGENGIAGVTVDLLDASLNTVATVTTDATGAISFSGVPDGNYTLRVTDTGNVLVDYYGTTPPALTGDRAVTINGGSPVAATSFGYNLTRTIGDTVFNDLNGDGVQDPGEPGISGVVVNLFDAAGTTLLATVTTNASGTYLFSGLTAGTSYTVSIGGIQPALVGFTLTTTDDDLLPSFPNIRNVTLPNTGIIDNVLTIDYGYRALNTPQLISGKIWSDENNNGGPGPDGTETGLENVTVDLLSGGTVVATVTTDANGDYSFIGQPAGTYTIRVTDSSGVINGYTQTFEVDAGNCGSCDGETAADTASGPGPVAGLNFGYYIEIIPTLVSIVEFQAYQGADGIVVEWVTGSEQGTAGFWLERRNDKTKKYERVNTNLLPALSLQGDEQGGIYQYVDTTAKVGEKYKYRLIEEEIWGSKKTYGPFKTKVEKSRQKSNQPHDASFKHAGKHFKHQAHERLDKIDRAAMRNASKAKRKAEYKAKQADRKAERKENREFKRRFDGVTMAVRNNGLIRVDALQLADELGLTLNDVENLIKKGQLKLTNRGKRVRWMADTDNGGLLFYGESIDSIYTLDNIYQISVHKGNGKPNQIRSRNAQPSNRADIDRFIETVVQEENLFPVLASAVDPESDYWYQNALLEGNQYVGEVSVPLQVDGVASGVELILDLHGGNEKGHEVEVYLNDQLLGSGSWNGLTDYRLTLPLSGQLNSGGSNTLKLVAKGASGNLFYYNKVTIIYERVTRAVNNQLIMTSPARGNVLVAGFSEDTINVWDVTNPRWPVEQLNAQISSDGGTGFQVRFRGREGRRYLAVADSAQTIIVVEALMEPEWRENVEHAVISTRDLETSAQALVDYRNSSGIPSQLFLIEDIYQQYNFGIASPLAIKTFLEKYAKSHGTRYVVMTGNGDYDYRGLQAYGGNFVPTLFTDTPFGLYSCDTCFGDSNGDNFSDFIVSRIPATSNAALLAYVEKLRAYESVNQPEAALLMAEKDDPRAGFFKSDSEEISALYPANYRITKIYLDDVSSTADARSVMFTAFDNGVSHVNYIGHGSLNQFANSSLLTRDDMGLLSNSSTPVITALTCSANRFEVPGLESLGERLVLDADGGAITMWGASAPSFNKPAVAMNKVLLEAMYQRGQTRVGEAIDVALRTTPDVPDYMLRIYILLGDAAVQIQ